MESNDPVWKMLERSPLPEPDAWFAARTVARLRREARPSAAKRFMALFAWTGSTAVVLVAAFMAFHFWAAPVKTDGETAKIQDALNFLADRGKETDLWLATSNL